MEGALFCHQMYLCLLLWPSLSHRHFLSSTLMFLGPQSLGSGEWAVPCQAGLFAGGAAPFFAHTGGAWHHPKFIQAIKMLLSFTETFSAFPFPARGVFKGRGNRGFRVGPKKILFWTEGKALPGKGRSVSKMVCILPP